MIRRLLACLVFAPALLAAQASRPAQASNAAAPVSTPSTWKVDPTHSELSFSIRHMVSRVRGQFDTWTGTIIGDLQEHQGHTVRG
jgi:polyisoprenoid-binding protein YceI